MKDLMRGLRKLAEAVFGGVRPEWMADALERYLKHAERRWDWDDTFATPSSYPVVRRVKRELYEMGFDIPPDERWRTDPELRGVLDRCIARLRGG